MVYLPPIVDRMTDTYKNLTFAAYILDILDPSSYIIINILGNFVALFLSSMPYVQMESLNLNKISTLIISK